MSRLLYFLATAAESGLSVFGIRGTYEQPAYRVVHSLPDGVEVRAYAPRVAAETDIRDGNDGEAFGRLFRYITGANQGGRTLAMTVPVQQEPRPGRTLAMTVPVEISGEVAAQAGPATMRFFLPHAVAAAPPASTDMLVRIVSLPATAFGVIRFSGTLSAASRDQHAARLRTVLANARIAADGPQSTFSYDPPFAIPFLRRNEVAIQVAAGTP